MNQSQSKRMLIYDDRRALTSALSLIESGDNDLAIGDRRSLDGPAIGRFQIHQSAWDDISAMRAKEGRASFTYHSAHNRYASEEYAYYLLNAINAEFIRHHRHSPHPSVLYACWSLGPSIIAKIPRMRNLKAYQIPHDAIMLIPDVTKPYSFLTSVGYTTYMAKRKLETGVRYSNLLFDHTNSVRLFGRPTLYR